MKKKPNPRHLIFAVATMALGGFPTAAEAELTAHWLLDDGAGIMPADSSGNGNDGIFGFDQSWTDDTPPTGFANDWALQFDGVDDYVSTDYPGVLGGAARTLSFWVKTTATNTHGIVAYGNSLGNGEKWHLRVNDAAGNGPVGAIRTEVQGDFHIGSTVINDGAWHHVVSVFPASGTTADDVIHYVDGSVEGIGGVGNGSPSINTTMVDLLTIGRRTQGTSQNYFAGLVDDVRVYDRELSAAEVMALPSAPSTNGLVAYYDFEDGLGSSIATDKGSGGNDGTLNGVMTSPTAMWSSDVPLGTGLMGSLEFNGADSWVDTQVAGIGGSGDRTFAMWIKADPSNATVDNGFLGYGRTANGEKWHLRVNTGAADGVVGAFRLEVQGGRIVGTTDIADGEWHHIAVTFEDDGTPMLGDSKLYVDGELDVISGLGDIGINTVIDAQDSKTISLGRRLQGETPRYFDGNLADVRIYDNALSAEEIAMLAIPEPSTGLLAMLGLLALAARRRA